LTRSRKSLNPSIHSIGWSVLSIDPNNFPVFADRHLQYLLSFQLLRRCHGLLRLLRVAIMWGPNQQPVPDSPSKPVPCAITPRTAAAGAAAAAGNGAGAEASATATAAGSQASYTAPSDGQPPSAPSAEGTFLLVDDPSAAGTRDSFASIVDDPFFLRYSGADPSPGLDAPATTATATIATTVTTPTPTTTTTTPSSGHRNEEQQRPWIPPRKESLSVTNPTPWVGWPPLRTLSCGTG
jgi:hypothetical protein